MYEPDKGNGDPDAFGYPGEPEQEATDVSRQAKPF